jgi:hypothetical protein
MQNAEVTPDIPSIFSTSPMNAVNGSKDGDIDSPHRTTAEKSLGMRHKGLEQEDLWKITNNTVSQRLDHSVDLNIPKRDLRGMVKM